MIKVLVVDDDFLVAKVHSGFIHRTPGFTVVGAAHAGHQAVIATERFKPDLVLLDIHLPDINGLDLIHDLRVIAPQLDVLVISAAREVQTVRRALRGGIVHYLFKPFSQKDLQERLEHYRNAYKTLDSSKQLAEQSDVNRVFGLGSPKRQLPKGCSVETLQLVESALREANDDLSAVEIAEQLGASRVSVRRYLEYLRGEGLLEVRLRYGVGRPERRYIYKRR